MSCPMRTVTEEQFLEVFAKSIFFDLIADELRLKDPKEVFEEVRRIKLMLNQIAA